MVPEGETAGGQGKVGICLSGGGLRASAFGLGALEALQKRRGLLKGPRHAAFLAAVSGGSYTAGAFAMVCAGAAGQPQSVDEENIARALAVQLGRPVRASDLDALRGEGPAGHPSHFVTSQEGRTARESMSLLHGPFLIASSVLQWRRKTRQQAADLEGGRVEVPWYAAPNATGEPHLDEWKTVQPDDPLAPGSPEVRHIRRHTRYLVDRGGAPVVALIFVLSLLWNLVVIFSVASAAGAPIGAMLGLATDPVQGSERIGLSDMSFEWWLGFALALLVAVGLLADGAQREGTTEHAPLASLRGRALAALSLFGGVVIPACVLWARNRLVEPNGTEAILNFGRTILLGAALLCVIALAAWLALGTADRSSRTGPATSGRRVLSLLRSLALAVLRLAATVLLPMTLLATTVSAATVSMGAVDGMWSAASLFWFALPTVVLIVAKRWGANGWALHRPYRRRLFSCFGMLRQQRVVDGTVQTRAQPRHPGLEPLLSACHPPDTPELLICATANVSDVGATPAGTQALSFIFGPEYVEVSGESGAGFKTADLEAALDVNAHKASIPLTLPAAVAVTGAAIAPAMGKMTVAPLRALMTALNMRLGLWLPNPLDPGMRTKVLEAARPSSRPLRVRPGPLYLFREMFGMLRRQSPFLYVSDGGHSENLGLVELFRRECDEIWCIDASGDPPGSALTIADALIAASGELGVECDLDLSVFEVDPSASEGRALRVKSVHAQQSFVQPRRDGVLSKGVLHVIKLGVGPMTPSSLRAYQRRRPTFPYDSTSHQVYDAELFDAYRLLGYSSAETALTCD